MPTDTITPEPMHLNLPGLGMLKTTFPCCDRHYCRQQWKTSRKKAWLESIYGNSILLKDAFRMHDEQSAIHEVVQILNECIHDLSNRNVIRLIEGYLLEMAVVIAQLGRVVSPGGTVFMVNDKCTISW